MNTISFMTANYVASPLGYRMTEGWGQGDRASNDYFRPIETFGQRFETLLADIHQLGFRAMDLWLAHLNYGWATAEHIAIARALLAKYNLRVASLAGWFGSQRQDFITCCELARQLQVPVLGGMTSLLDSDRDFLVEQLRDHGLRFGLENHPEKSPAEVLAHIGDGAGVLGTTVDTGWYGTQGYDAAQAILELGDAVFHVHLKDVLAAGEHDTCRYGRGVVPIWRCVQALQQIGYRGAISVEHEPELFDPTDDVRASYALLQGWLRETDEDRTA